ncbi:MlaD family protein [[Mycobacterium] nativiensis]|uniref:MlaD family protein n=1 Tax=[Mycobacterium] nativiensis TaxID=2855503 RepID=A0ABU5Y1V7_9MYCO|nr:MlaD family protein [Mycolicibacter sp. MYC340]MEB3034047.1 MlaD family protein [Mycolicibacter sp. MYC340]
MKVLAAVAAFCAIVMMFVSYIASLGIRVAPPSNRVSLSMSVADTNNAVVDSRVLLRGVPVGKVTEIETSIANATIHFYIDGKYQVPVDSVIRLDNLSALGESYIEIEPRSAIGPMFRNGQRIESEAVKQPPSISELGVSVARVLNQLDPDELERVIHEFDTAIPDPYAVLPNLERASLLLRSTTADLRGRGREVLENSQSLLENAAFVGPALADATPALRDLGPPLRRLWDSGMDAAVLRNDSPGSVYLFGKLLHRIQKFLDDRAPDLRVLTEPLMANVQAIAGATMGIDSSQVLANLLSTVPVDGAIDLHVLGSEGGAGR